MSVSGKGRRGGRVDRALIRPRPVLARPLEPELVRQRGGEERGQAAIDRMGVILLERVGAPPPRVHVERAVLLAGPGIVVLERGVVLRAQPEVELAQQGVGVVGPGDRPELVPEHPAERSVRERHQRGVDQAQAIGLLDIGVFLLVVREEEERLVPNDRSPERGAKLVLGEVRSEPGGGAARERVGVVGRERVVLAEVVRRAVIFIGARLGDHVEEAAAGAAELGIGAVGHHDEVLHCVQVEGEGRALAAALLAEERVVEVGAVDRHVVVNALLAADADLVAVRALHDGHVRGQRREIEDVAAVVGQAFHRLRAEPRRALRPGDVDRGLARHRDLLQLHGLGGQRERLLHRLAQPERQPRPLRLLEAQCPRGHVIGADPEESGDVDPVIVGGQNAFCVGLGVPERHRGAGQRPARGVGDRTADHAGRGLCLGVQPGGNRRQGGGETENRRAQLGSVMGRASFHVTRAKGHAAVGDRGGTGTGRRRGWVGCG